MIRCKYTGADLRAIRVRHGVGRPVASYEVDYAPYGAALQTHGSQRAAAKALGIALSTFQRRLAKEQAA